MEYPQIDIQRDGDIEIVSLDRADELNTISQVLANSLTTYFQDLVNRPQVRVVILRASGRAFCAGVDLRGWAVREGVTQTLHVLSVQTAIGNIYRAMRRCPQPIIGLGHGAACGGGFSMLLASDVRFGSPDLKMNAAYIKIGLGGCDMASSYLLPRLVGSSLASELLLTGRWLHAERALRLGLLSEIVDQDALLDKGMELASEMLQTAPWGLRLTKQALNLNIDAQSMEAAMAIEDRQQVMLTTTSDYQEAIASFLEKRPPEFTDN